MKLATMKVTVPVDDAVPVQQVYRHLRAVLEQRETETLQLEFPNNGSDTTAPELPSDLPRTGRLHWPAVEVVQATERLPKAEPPPKGKRVSTSNSERT